jgi:hypothetical protein
MDKPTCKTAACERPTVTRDGLCRRCYGKAYYLANREREIARALAYQAANPEYLRSYYLANRERILRAQKTRRAANPGWRPRSQTPTTAAQVKAWRKANAESIAAKVKAYAAANREHIAEVKRAWRLANPEINLAYHAAWKLANPELVREIGREAAARRKAQKLGLVVTKADYGAILAEHGMVCHICGLDILTRTDLHFDHVIPLARGGAHVVENIRPSHSFCNRSKGARVI